MHLSIPSQQAVLSGRSCTASRCSPVSSVTAATRCRCRSVVRRAASNSAGSVSSLAHSVASDAAAASGCPFSALKQQLLPQANRQHAASGIPVPGPAPFSLESLGDVSTIFFEGLHVAMLQFSQKYGPICRYAALMSTLHWHHTTAGALSRGSMFSSEADFSTSTNTSAD